QLRTCELRDSEERFRALSASSPIGILETGTDGGCRYANLRWQVLTGLAPEKSLGLGWVSAVHPIDRGRGIEALNLTAREGAELSQEFQIIMTDGQVRWVHGRAKGLRSAEGSLLGAVVTIEDISERRRAAEDLFRAKQAAEDASRLKSEFLANMSHE